MGFKKFQMPKIPSILIKNPEYITFYLALTICIIVLDSLGLVAIIAAFSGDKTEIFGYELVIDLYLIALLFFIKGLLKVFSESIKVKIQQKRIFSYVSDILSRVSLISLFKISEFKYRLISGLGVELERFSKNIISQIVLIESFTGAIVYVLVSAVLNLKITLISLFLGSFSSFLFRYFAKKIKLSSVSFSKKVSQSGEILKSLFDSYEFLKINNLMVDYIENVTITKFWEQENVRARVGYLNSIVLGLREPLLIVVLIFTVLIAKSTGSAITEIGASLILLYRAVTYVNVFQVNISKYYETYGSISALDKLYTDVNNITDGLSLNRNFMGATIDIKSAMDKNNWYFENLELCSTKYARICGESGMGKSTFLRVLAGEKYPWMTLSESSKPLVEKPIGFLPQDSEFLNKEFLDFIKESNEFNKVEFERAFTYLLPNMDSVPSDPSSLSGGEKKRLVISILLAMKRTRLLLDEPLSGLDENNRKKVIDLLMSDDSIESVVFTSHVDIDFNEAFLKIDLSANNDSGSGN